MEGERAGTSDLDLTLRAIAFAVDAHGLGVMQHGQTRKPYAEYRHGIHALMSALRQPTNLELLRLGAGTDQALIDRLPRRLRKMG